MGDSKRNIRYLKDKDMSFINLYRNYFKDHEFVSIFHLLISLLISLLILFFYKSLDILDFTNQIYNIIISTSTDVLSVLIAAFGLYAVITDKSFSEKIYKMGQIGNLLFPFWLNATLWVINLVFGMIIKLALQNNGLFYFMDKSALLFSVFLFILTLGYTLALIGDILKLTIHRIQLNIISEKLDSEEVLYNLLNEEENVDKSYLKFFYFYLLLSGIMLLYTMIWYYYLKTNVIFSIILGCTYSFFIFMGFKFLQKLEQKKQDIIIKKFKTLVKLYLIILWLWVGLFII